MIVNEKSLKGIHPKVRKFVEKMAVRASKELGRNVIVYSTFRSIEEQNKLYAQGRTTPGKIVTNAKGGESAHNYYTAVDFWVCKEDGKTPEFDAKTEVFKKYLTILKDEDTKDADVLVEPIPGDLNHVELKDWRMYKGTPPTPFEEGNEGGSGNSILTIGVIALSLWLFLG